MFTDRQALAAFAEAMERATMAAHKPQPELPPSPAGRVVALCTALIAIASLGGLVAFLLGA